MADRDKNLNECRTCPYCDEEIAEAAFPYCEACRVNILRCPNCGMGVPRDMEECPNCGANLKESVPRGD